MKILIHSLIYAAKEIGLGDIDINNSTDLLENREYGLAFDTIITQLYEHEIEIDVQYYKLIEVIAHKMQIPEEEYSFMKELVRADNIIPKPVKDRLAKILATLEPLD